jgi:hypothetical protein
MARRYGACVPHSHDARFESPVTFTIDEHLTQCGVPLSDLAQKSGMAADAYCPSPIG